jgi:HTH-type transcriptional regulator/antitoxin HipB
MPTYPIRFTAQLRQHLKAFRKARNLTQAQLGDLVGISQARVAEIEANPGLVKFEQLMQLLAALEVTISLGEERDLPARGAKKGKW